MSFGTLLAPCVVHALLPDVGNVGTTAIDKRPVPGSVKVGKFGLYADVQADRKHHGGLDQAVYAYAQEDADFWAAELARELPAGWFGENLRVLGIDLVNSRIGDRWRLGSVELEVTGPRAPCQTFARWVGGDDERSWVKRFAAAGRVGAYLRVLKTGTVSAANEITVTDAAAGAPTVLEVFRS